MGVEIFRYLGVAVAQPAGKTLGRSSVLGADGGVCVPEGMEVQAVAGHEEHQRGALDMLPVGVGAYQGPPRHALHLGALGDLPGTAILAFIDMEVSPSGLHLVGSLLCFPLAQQGYKILVNEDLATAGLGLWFAEYAADFGAGIDQLPFHGNGPVSLPSRW